MRSHLRSGLLLALAGGLGLTLVSCSSPPPEAPISPTTPPAPAAGGADTDQVAAASQGQTLFTANCANCHGPDGKGGEGLAGPDLTHVPMEHTADEISTVIRDGGPKMPAFADRLSGEQITALIGHLDAMHQAGMDAGDSATEGAEIEGN